MREKFLLAIVVISSVVFLSACASGLAKTELPQGPQKISEVVPAMGGYWAEPSQLRLGPIYLADKGEVIGLE